MLNYLCHSKNKNQIKLKFQIDFAFPWGKNQHLSQCLIKYFVYYPAGPYFLLILYQTPGAGPGSLNIFKFYLQYKIFSIVLQFPISSFTHSLIIHLLSTFLQQALLRPIHTPTHYTVRSTQHGYFNSYFRGSINTTMRHADHF